jgi:glycosyltransferase involved in cell wall biosynthesis
MLARQRVEDPLPDHLPRGDGVAASQRPRLCVVGSGTRFLSGISYYTWRLANAFAGSNQVSVILMRRLLPARFYPGRARVGHRLTSLTYDPTIRVFDGVDWFWLPSIVRALAFLIRHRPELVSLQWWSGTVLHSYLALALAARLYRGRVVIEFHELLDTGELRLPFARAYVALLAPLLIRLASGFVVHSEFDRQALEQKYDVSRRPVSVIPHGPYDNYQRPPTRPAHRDAPATSCNLLFFGVIRPFKGLEDLIQVFDSIPESQIAGFWLTVVGETWESWTLPADLIARSRYRDRITFVNRYVTDEEVAAFFSGADAVVLPYHRSSASGPLHVAMSCGLPVIVTRVGGLPEAAAGYQGAILVPPRDPHALAQALVTAAAMRGRRFSGSHGWEYTVGRYEALHATLAHGRPEVQGASA